MDWQMMPWAAYDTETTGFGADARILELAIVRFEDGQPVHWWSSLFNPLDVDWDSAGVRKALETNKLTRSMLEGSPQFGDLITEIRRQLDMDVWVAHNMRFDRKMLQQEFDRVGAALVQAPLQICTLNMAREFNETLGDNKLPTVAARFGVPFVETHRARADAEAAGCILRNMIRDKPVWQDHAEMQRHCRRLAIKWENR